MTNDLGGRIALVTGGGGGWAHVVDLADAGLINSLPDLVDILVNISSAHGLRASAHKVADPSPQKCGDFPCPPT